MHPWGPDLSRVRSAAGKALVACLLVPNTVLAQGRQLARQGQATVGGGLTLASSIIIGAAAARSHSPAWQSCARHRD